jgi:hypothetical protein
MLGSVALYLVFPFVGDHDTDLKAISAMIRCTEKPNVFHFFPYYSTSMVYILRNDTNLRAPQSTQVLSTPYGNYGTSSDVPRLRVRLLSIAFPIETGVRCSFWWPTAAPDVIGRE